MAQDGLTQTPEEQAVANLVIRRQKRAESVHKTLRDRWNAQYRDYRNYVQLRKNITQAGVRDRGGVILDAKRAIGADFHIATAYAVVETVTPRAIAQPPRIRAIALDESAVDSALKVEAEMNCQLSDINYELIVQATARRAFIHGLGVQKGYWKNKTRNVRMNVPRRIVNGLKTITTQEVIHNGPMAESVDIFDFFWDPTAENMETADWVIQRTWRSEEYVARMLQPGPNGIAPWGVRIVNGEQVQIQNLSLEDIKTFLSENNRGNVWRERLDAQNLPEYEPAMGPLLEVWEYHDREQVITVVGQKLLVQQRPNPHFNGDLPFQIFRPTIVPGEFCGIGEIEPIADLIKELNTLRTQRRDAATYSLQPPFFYQTGSFPKEDFVFGPGVFIETLGDPHDLVWQVPMRDIPASGYQEEDAIKSDMEKVSGISETVAGADPSAPSQMTATGTQLSLQAANTRIKQKARNLVLELATPAARDQLWLNRQYQLEAKTRPVPDANSETGYSYSKVTPKDWNAPIRIEVVEDSMEPANPAQDRQDALNLYQNTANDPAIDPTKRAVYFLKKYGIPDAESWVAQQAAPQANGIDPAVIGEALQQAGLGNEQGTQILQLIEELAQRQPPTDNGAASNGAAPPPPVPQGAQ